MPGKLEDLIDRINASEDEKITSIIADETMGWALEVAEKMKIRWVAFWPASAALLTSLFSIQKLIDDGIIDSNGTPLKNQMIQLAPAMPAMNSANLIWTCVGDLTTQKIIVDVSIKNNNAVKVADWILCNSAHDFEPGAFTLAPKILPIGPLLAGSREGDSVGHFWPEDSNCLKWLDQQPLKSVIYVAFGSFTIFDKSQFQELALGLEISCRPFLWAVRPDITSDTNAYPEGFQERVATRGQMVEWAPQQKVLSHPSIACFLSHCGWNSTMEGVANGVPFLCWPYFADQFLNEIYITDVWKVGLTLNRNLTPAMPVKKTAIIIWTRIGDLTNHTENDIDLTFKTIKITKMADRKICNSAYDLEPGALPFTLTSEIIPISTCMKWLDQQPPKSVIYVAFGSFTVFYETQIQESAFLWVVRPDIISETNA
ncbi:hypothetical protein GH714_012614 [Hevea brasiliensis]|uniref:Anthocyanidin 3-O-glucosyltransferase n=1 Tax=Hevea brasiliensis TaxID=3981 RepID=A0A6A6MMB2_HEVBR|nr:hypothetical protein GH714_012614 [Hevea brasiliensis]